MTKQIVEQIIIGVPSTDGAGVKLLRVLHGPAMQRRLDPWLMLDYFSSDVPEDYLAGFPDHPHRGFETITIMLEGRMLHRDSRGNQGLLQAGDVQWMSAARGIVHSEMPQQEAGRLAGFQLWLNLPASHKMQDARWQDIKASSIPRWEDGRSGFLRLIAGHLPHQLGAFTCVSAHQQGPLEQHLSFPMIIHGELGSPQPGDGSLEIPVSKGHHAFIYMINDGLTVDHQKVAGGAMAVISPQVDRLTVGGHGAFLYASAKPIGEPIAQMGPFVMNTQEELMQALEDYQRGRLG
ncbi:MAG: pirin family protein [Betaproteobacteria bacterium]|nr:pirin family protein [Pseudomonadota bacterium]NBS38633.1 pirin family protein [Betaproteobacteria bacterium]NBY54746.1 pirin family protein [Betaproteobacteria bacterium]NDC02117.1 pirin family protein [Betaproteobacteria bacterium]NDG81853.1 pirin family protein [Betaproteobacteria bacterium]